MPDWSRWSHQQIAALEALDFTPPLHETHLRKRYGVRGNTIASLINAGLVRRTCLYDEHRIAPMPFLSLTQEGRAVKRDWQRWNDRVRAKVASLFRREP